MVAMSRVVVRAQHHVEIITGAIAYQTQETRTVALPRPILEHADAASIRQAKPGDIQGIGRGVLAEPSVGAIVDITAGKTALIEFEPLV